MIRDRKMLPITRRKIKTKPKLKQIIKLGVKDTKRVIIIVVHMFKKHDKRLTYSVETWKIHFFKNQNYTSRDNNCNV